MKLPSSRSGSRFVAVAVTILLASAGVLAAPVAASAAAYGTPAVATQRMTGPSLNTAQAGWYAKGQRLTLVCHVKGQPVKGAFSRYIPGGWDDIWFKVSDGYYVADVDIETGSSTPVVGPCPPSSAPAPAPAPTSKETRAVNWALSQVGSNSYTNLCGKFVANAYGMNALGYHTALLHYNALKSAGQIKTTGTPPKGALVFSRSSSDGGAGHVVIATGDGRYVSGGMSAKYGSGRTVQIIPSWNVTKGATYLGWAYAPASWPGK